MYNKYHFVFQNYADPLSENSFFSCLRLKNKKHNSANKRI